VESDDELLELDDELDEDLLRPRYRAWRESRFDWCLDGGGLDNLSNLTRGLE